MSEWRAVRIDHARKYADLPIISSSLEMVTVMKGLTGGASGLGFQPAAIHVVIR